MKKMFTLFAGMLLTVAAMAADRYPSVTINSSRNFRIVVDGRNFFGNNSSIRLDNLGAGFHTIKVFEIRRGFFVKAEKLVTSTSFKLGRQDMMIYVDNFGRVDMYSQNNRGRYSNDRDWDDHDRRDDHRDDHRYDQRNNHGYDQRDQSPSRRF